VRALLQAFPVLEGLRMDRPQGDRTLKVFLRKRGKAGRLNNIGNRIQFAKTRLHFKKTNVSPKNER